MIKLGDAVCIDVKPSICTFGWTVGTIIGYREVYNKFNSERIINYDVKTPYGQFDEIDIEKLTKLTFL